MTVMDLPGIHISGSTPLVGVLGHPVTHSLSPKLHNYWLQTLNLNGAYVPVSVDEDHLETVLRAMPHMGFMGANVTVPHKEMAFRLADETDELAWLVGAVNTLDVLPDGRLRGRNTDVYGFAENIKKGAPDFVPSKGPAVVIGAGGASRAVVVALSQMNVTEIRLINRTRSRAETLAQALRDLVTTPVTVVSWSNRQQVLSDAQLLVNTTSLGMSGQPALDLPLDDLPQDALVTDIVYAPLETPLLAQARAQGNQTVDGLGMLLYQAQASFSGWFKTEPPVDQHVRDLVLNTKKTPKDSAASLKPDTPKPDTTEEQEISDPAALVDAWLEDDT